MGRAITLRSFTTRVRVAVVGATAVALVVAGILTPPSSSSTSIAAVADIGDVAPPADVPPAPAAVDSPAAPSVDESVPTDSTPERSEPENPPSSASNATPSAKPKPAPEEIVVEGAQVQVRGTVVAVVHSETLLLRVSGGGYLPIDGAGLEDLVGTSQIVTLDLPADVVKDVAREAENARNAASIITTGPNAPDFKALERHALAVGVLDVATTTAAATEQPPLANSLGTGRAQVVSATHEVWAVPISPNSGSYSGDQSSANVTAAVSFASSYWAAQSDGQVTFSLEAVASWSSTSISCASPSTFYTLANIAEGLAVGDGYTGGANEHVVMVFPPNAPCGSTLGTATIGWTVNSGGVLWVRGTTSDMSLATWSHELGHNLSFGHANTFECDTGVPSLANTDCYYYEYSDLFDVMGAAAPGVDGGTFSSPNAIDTGLWGATNYHVATAGSTDYTINVMSSDVGKRAVVIEDPIDGQLYFVEARSYTGRDAQIAPWASDLGLGPGVRILQLGTVHGVHQSFVLAKSSADSTTNYGAGEEYTSASGAFTVATVATSDTEATVTVTLRGLVSPGTTTVMGDAQYGSTLTAATSGWGTEPTATVLYTYEWLRDGTPISGATASTYKLTADDIGHPIAARVTGYVESGLSIPATVTTSPTVAVTALPITSQSVSLSGTFNVGETITAVTDPWTLGVAVDPVQTLLMEYAWFADGSPIAGADESTYELTAAELGTAITVRVTGSSPGYETAMETSAPSAAVALGVIAGTPVVEVSPDVDPTTLVAEVTGVTESGAAIAYQWMRGTEPIASRTNYTLTRTALDSTEEVWVQVTVTKTGYASVVVESAPTFYPPQQIRVTGSLDELYPQESVTLGTVFDSDNAPRGSVIQYQWLRDGVPIPGATGPGYVPTAADVGTRLSVVITMSFAGWASGEHVTSESEPVSASGPV